MARAPVEYARVLKGFSPLTSRSRAISSRSRTTSAREGAGTTSVRVAAGEGARRRARQAAGRRRRPGVLVVARAHEVEPVGEEAGPVPAEVVGVDLDGGHPRGGAGFERPTGRVGRRRAHEE